MKTSKTEYIIDLKKEFVKTIFREKINKEKELKKNLENEINILEREYYQRNENKPRRINNLVDEEEYNTLYNE
jgi:hypothetical protein